MVIIRRGTNYVQYTDGENVHKPISSLNKRTQKNNKNKTRPRYKRQSIPELIMQG